MCWCQTTEVFLFFVSPRGQPVWLQRVVGYLLVRSCRFPFFISGSVKGHRVMRCSRCLIALSRSRQQHTHEVGLLIRRQSRPNLSFRGIRLVGGVVPIQDNIVRLR